MRSSSSLALPKLRGTLLWVVGVCFGLWALFAVLLNWVHTGFGLYAALILDADRVRHGELWRLLTAPLIHEVGGQGGVFHILFSLLILYFFGSPLQSTWGSKRMAIFLITTALCGEALQLCVEWLLPAGSVPVLQQRIYFGSYAVAFATLVAWGFSHKTQTVYFFFFPMRGITLVGVNFAFYALLLLSAGRLAEGALAPLGAAGAGYLLGASTPSPLRKAYLRWKLRKLEKTSTRKRGPHAGSHLRVIEGAAKKRDDKGPPPKSPSGWLN